MCNMPQQAYFNVLLDSLFNVSSFPFFTVLLSFSSLPFTHSLLSFSLSVQLFLRDAEQVDTATGAQEAFLSNDDLGVR